VCEEWISLGGSERSSLAFTSDFIIAASRAVLRRSLFFRFPLGFDKFVALETAERGIDGTAR